MLDFLQVPVNGIDGGAGDAECGLDALVFKNPDDYFCDFHDDLTYMWGPLRLSRWAHGRCGRETAAAGAGPFGE